MPGINIYRVSHKKTGIKEFNIWTIYLLPWCLFKSIQGYNVTGKNKNKQRNIIKLIQNNAAVKLPPLCGYGIKILLAKYALINVISLIELINGPPGGFWQDQYRAHFHTTKNQNQDYHLSQGDTTIFLFFLFIPFC